MDQPILVDIAGGVARLTINRPNRLNAMDSHSHLALSKALDACAMDKNVRVLVLTGAGTRAFSVGRDLHEMAEKSDQAIEDRWQQTTRLTDRLDYPKPIIARVQGHALGGGFEIAMACDIIVASTDSSFALPEPKRGLIPFAGGVHRLPRQIPLKVAMGHLLTGRPMSAERAYALGLVNQVVPPDVLDLAIDTWVADILACAPLAIRSIKQSVAFGMGRPLENAMAITIPAEELRKASQDSIEGPRAFAEKRPPIWSGQ